MNRSLTDPERIELTALCAALADGHLSAADKIRFNSLLRTGDEARQFYLRHAALSASLFSYAAEMQSEAPVPKAAPKKWYTTPHFWVAAAAMVALASLVLWQGAEDGTDSPLAASASASAEPDTVALMSGTKDCVWSGPAMTAGAALKAGQKLQLTKGVAEITFDSGAQVTLDGPASFIVSSAWDASFESGALRANVPAEAAGFRVTSPSVEVVDQGAEFSMIADASSAEVLVLKGAVEAASRRSDVRPVVLRARESRRFAPEGSSAVGDPDRKFARLNRVLKLDRSESKGGYTHWAFDASEGSLMTAEVKGRKKNTVHTRMVADEKAEAAATLTEGRYGKGLGFDGRLFAKATVPGLATPGEARTIAFWARVSEDAPLTGASASMLGWGAKNRRSDGPRVSIGWNKHPAQGPVGALRTDLGMGQALGSTNLRDGRWHHIAVVLIPMPNGRMQAKQYLDGRLEGSGFRPPPRHPLLESEASDTLWLGRGPGDRPREALFTGALDELFIVDRPLSPSEIVRLMRENQPPEIIVAGAL